MYNNSGSGFVMFLVGIGFFIGLALTLLFVYLVIRVVEQYLWPRGKDFGRSGRGAVASSAQAHAAPPVSPTPPAQTPTAEQSEVPSVPDAAPGHEEGETTRAIRILDLRLANGEMEIDDYKSRREALGRPDNG